MDFPVKAFPVKTLDCGSHEGLAEARNYMESLDSPKSEVCQVDICLDFDGVIHSYDGERFGNAETPNPPVPGAIDGIRTYLKEFTVAVYSARSGNPVGRNVVIEYMRRHGGMELVDALEFPDHKPIAHVYIDDRAVRFNGSWISNTKIYSLFTPYHGKVRQTKEERKIVHAIKE